MSGIKINKMNSETNTQWRLGTKYLVAGGRDPIEVLETMCHWLEKDRCLYRQQAQNARRLGHPRAAYDVADLAWAAASS